jgi:adenylate kinase
MKLILLGAPGSGKGTQAAYITEKYDLPHISTGDIFRENMKNLTPIGIRIKEVMDKGNLCPDELTIELVKDRVQQPDCKKGYLLDGFPRNVAQAEALDKFDAPDVVIDIDVDLEKIEKRVVGRRSCSKCNGSFHVDFIGQTDICPDCGGKLTIRKDDNPETVKERLSVYQKQTLPLIEYYSKQGKLVKVDGNRLITQVFEEIVKVLG